MRRDETSRGVDDARLHLGERFATGEPEPTRNPLHLLPLRKLHQVLQVGAGPLTEVALEQTARDPHSLLEPLRDRRRGLAGPFERRRVDGGDLAGERRDAFGNRVRLLPSLVREVQALGPSGQLGARGGRLTVADQQHERPGRWLRLRSRHDQANLPWGPMDSLRRVEQEVVDCRACPRLVAWRELVAREKVARFRDWDYWGRPIPGFGDPRARLLIVGLAPAAHGGNRTGRVFTGDRSGDFLFASL